MLTGPAAGIARSMMIGDQSRITAQTREVMAASGLAHIYSIWASPFYRCRRRASGAACDGTVRRARQLGSTKLVALVAIVAAFAYLVLAGGSSNVPAFRSTIMIALIFGAILAGRRALTMRNVAIAALIIVVTDPASVFRPSFQLSFAAVVALVGMYETLRSDGERKTGIGGRIWGSSARQRHKPYCGRRDAAVLGVPLPADGAARHRGECDVARPHRSDHGRHRRCCAGDAVRSGTAVPRRPAVGTRCAALVANSGLAQ